MEVQEKSTSMCSEVSKSQAVRLVDVFLIAPFLIYIGFKAKGLTKAERAVLYILGGATAFYNGGRTISKPKKLIFNFLFLGSE